MTKVLLTGNCGYLGSILTGKLLEIGCQVVGVDSLLYGNASALLPYLGHPNFEFHREDVRNWLPVQNLAKSCDVIIPLAALVGAPLCAKYPVDAVAVNEVAVRTLVKSLSKHQRVVSPNTNSGYGTTDGTTACVETDHLNPISVYGITKCAAEAAVLEHPNSVSLRLATVFGASPRMRMDLMVNSFTCELWRGRALTLFEPNFLRNFVGVRDVADAFIHFSLLRQGLIGAYNLGLPTANLTKMGLAHRICDVLGLSRDVVTTGTGIDPDRRNYWVSNDKVLATGFVFRHELDDGIKEVARTAAFHTTPQLARMSNV